MADEPKKVFTDDISIVDGQFLTSIQGGDDSAPTTSPRFSGHFHDLPPGQMGSSWGHVGQIDLTNHVTGRLTLPTPEFKSIKLAATQAVPLTSSLFWTLPIPNDAYSTLPQPMYLNIYWSANGAISPGSIAFRVDWVYLQAGQNVIPPSIINRGITAWPSNTVASNNPTPTTFRFKVSATSASRLYVNDTLTGGNLIQLTLPANTPNIPLNQFLLLGLEITSAPTVTLNQPMSQVNIFAIDVLYPSQTLGSNTIPVLLNNDPGLSDF
jgi:hypothetical protein